MGNLKDIFMMNLTVGTKEQALTAMCSMLINTGYVTADFMEEILKREQGFPTGLPVQLYGVAVPHVDSKHVIESQVVFAALKKPVVFQQMGNNQQNIDVSFIFMLAFRDPTEHLQHLQKLFLCLQDTAFMQKLNQIKNKSHLLQLINNIET